MFFARQPISFPAGLALSLEKALWPGTDARQMSRRKEALRRLWAKLAKGRGQVRGGEQHYSFQREEADAYAAYYLPANCLKIPLVLEESFLLGVDPMPAAESTWLDFGTGPGTAYWGLAWWCGRRKKKLRFHGWDQSAVFQAIARTLAAAAPREAQPAFIAGEGEPLELVKKYKPTHVSFVNSIAEIYPDNEKRLAELSRILRELRALKKADGRERFLVIVEPGSRESSRELAALKDQLQAASLGRVLLPCMDARPCGALADERDWCHEEVACEFPEWLNELGAGAGMRKESMLFSYALIQAGEPLPPGSRLRIVSQRMERKGQVECRLCTAAGKKPVRVQRSKAHEKNEFFLGSVRGDLWASAVIGEKNDLEEATPEIAAGIYSVFDGE